MRLFRGRKAPPAPPCQSFLIGQSTIDAFSGRSRCEHVSMLALAFIPTVTLTHLQFWKCHTHVLVTSEGQRQIKITPQAQNVSVTPLIPPFQCGLRATQGLNTLQQPHRWTREQEKKPGHVALKQQLKLCTVHSNNPFISSACNTSDPPPGGDSLRLLLLGGCLCFVHLHLTLLITEV